MLGILGLSLALSFQILVILAIMHQSSVSTTREQAIYIWEHCLTFIKDIVQAQDFQQYFSNTKAVQLSSHTLSVEVLSQTNYDYLKSSKATELVGRALRSVKTDLQVEYILLSAEIVWKRCLTFIKDNIDPKNYQKWFANIGVLSLIDQKLTLILPSRESVEVLETHYINLITSAIHKEIGKGIELSYKCPRNAQLGQNLTNLPTIDPQLQDEYKFSNFAQGEENVLCHKIGLDIAKNPGKSSFNPLFVYGSTGVGKTHLIQAIGHACRELHPQKVIMYISCQRFIEHFQNCARSNRINDFVQLYQNIEVLLIDDIQFFTNAPKSQDVFFNIFNHLYSSMGRQIILTSDRRPQELEQVHDRLISRFTGGLQEELKLPGEELRYQILKIKCREDGMNISDEILRYLAKHCTGNGRDLTGIRNRLMVRAIHLGKTIDMQMAKQAIADYLPASKAENSEVLSCEKIIHTVSDYFHVPATEITKKGRGKQELNEIRQIAIFLSRNMTNATLKKIGQQFGGKDHSTVKYACEVVEKYLQIDSKTREHIEAIKQKLQ